VNISMEILAPLLRESYRKGKAKVDKGQTVNWRVHPSNFRKVSGNRFEAGSVDLSAGWFAQAKEVLSIFGLYSLLTLFTEARRSYSCLNKSTGPDVVGVLDIDAKDFVSFQLHFGLNAPLAL
jgi:hypothetical protein